MKYIRTKDGRIYEIIEETENGYELRGPFEKKINCNCYMIKRVFGDNSDPTYQIADTIEELCDEFVWVSVNGEYHNRKANTYGLETSKMHRNSSQIKEIYGAIWTDKGLIYVAKMNEKGELELLWKSKEKW